MQEAMTKRPTNPEVEEILRGYFPVLDHGFISLVDYMGGDADIEQAARVSYGHGTRQRSKTRGLIRYLMRHHHTTPFEMVEFKFHVAMPLFVARQWIRQRMSSTNEYSGRYSLMPMLFYRPDELRRQSDTNRQGSSGDLLSEDEEGEAQALFALNQYNARNSYEWMTEHDVARELARIDLPLSTYTYWYWKIDLLNLLKFLTRRCDSRAQYEIRAYADIMAGMVKRATPIAYEAWCDYWLMGEQMSRQELEVLTRLIAVRQDALEAAVSPWGEGSNAALTNGMMERAHGLSPREVDELRSKLNSPPAPDFELDLREMKDPEFFQDRVAAAVPSCDPVPTP